MEGGRWNQKKKPERVETEETDPSSSKTSSTNLVEVRFGLGFSIAMHCSTNVLKLICFFFPERDSLGVRSCSLPVDVPGDVDSSIDKSHSADSFDNTRGGESLRSASRGVRARRMWVSLLVWVRNGRPGGRVDDGVCSCDAGGSLEGGSSTSKCGAVGRQRISVMLRCFKIGFVYDPFARIWAEAACIEAAGLGRGLQSEPGCNGPYSQVTSESLSL